MQVSLIERVSRHIFDFSRKKSFAITLLGQLGSMARKFEKSFFFSTEREREREKERERDRDRVSERMREGQKRQKTGKTYL